MYASSNIIQVTNRISFSAHTLSFRFELHVYTISFLIARLWNALSVGSSSESLPLVSDATAVAFRPDGGEVAVASLNGHITFFDARTSAQTGVIEGRKDLGSGRADADLVTAKKSLQVREVFLMSKERTLGFSRAARLFELL